jgi:hypothetical protein
MHMIVMERVAARAEHGREIQARSPSYRPLKRLFQVAITGAWNDGNRVVAIEPE